MLPAISVNVKSGAAAFIFSGALVALSGEKSKARQHKGVIFKNVIAMELEFEIEAEIRFLCINLIIRKKNDSA